jgi:ABC-type nickel/cobalt efflux system permease component RcnA
VSKLLIGATLLFGFNVVVYSASDHSLHSDDIEAVHDHHQHDHMHNDDAASHDEHDNDAHHANH